MPLNPSLKQEGCYSSEASIAQDHTANTILNLKTGLNLLSKKKKNELLTALGGRKLYYVVVVVHSRSVVYTSFQPHGLELTRLLCPWNCPGKSTRMGCPFLHRGIFSTQGLNSRLLYCRQILYRQAIGKVTTMWFLPNKTKLEDCPWNSKYQMPQNDCPSSPTGPSDKNWRAGVELQDIIFQELRGMSLKLLLYLGRSEKLNFDI